MRVVGRRRDKELIRCVDVGRGSRRSVWALAGCGPSLAVLLSREVEGARTDQKVSGLLRKRYVYR